MASVESALRAAVSDLNVIEVRWALVGGLAVSARATPRFTKDLDFAVAVADDAKAEDVVHRLQARPDSAGRRPTPSDGTHSLTCGYRTACDFLGRFR